MGGAPHQSQIRRNERKDQILPHLQRPYRCNLHLSFLPRMADTIPNYMDEGFQDEPCGQAVPTFPLYEVVGSPERGYTREETRAVHLDAISDHHHVYPQSGIGFNGYDDLWMNDAKNLYADALKTHAYHDTREWTYSAVVIIQRDMKDRLKYIIGKYDIEPCVLTKPEWASDAWLKGTFAHKLKSAVQESEYGAPTSNNSLRNGVVIAIGDKVKNEVLVRLGYTRIPKPDAHKEGSSIVFPEIYQADGDLPLVLWTDGKIQFSLKKISKHASQLIKTVTNSMANPLKGGKKFLDASRHILIKNKNI